jgi:hypothetical protein
MSIYERYRGLKIPPLPSNFKEFVSEQEHDTFCSNNITTKKCSDISCSECIVFQHGKYNREVFQDWIKSWNRADCTGGIKNIHTDECNEHHYRPAGDETKHRIKQLKNRHIAKIMSRIEYDGNISESIKTDIKRQFKFFTDDILKTIGITVDSNREIDK